jgi:aspartate/tyrosine/aromatic aminotransferase
MSQVAVVERTYPRADTLSAALRLRSQLSSAVRSAWSSPDAYTIRDALRDAAVRSGYASELSTLMSTIANDIRAIAERTIKVRYREIWGRR